MNAAVFYGPNKISVQSVPAAKGSTVLRVKACAVCGYDARVFRNGHSKVIPPVILGHELCGEVMETVKSGGNEVKAGSRVVVCPVVPCLDCPYCRSGNYNLCNNLKEIGSTVNGGFAEFVGIPENVLKIGGLVPVPDDLSDEEAALLEPLACCLNSISRMGVHEKDCSVVIIGDGTMGLIHLQLLKLSGAKVAVIGKVKSRMQKARDLKADMVAEYQDPDATAQKVLDFTSSIGASAVIVATSNPVAIELAKRICAKNALINLFAGMPKDHQLVLDTNWLHYNQLSVTGAFGSTPSRLREAAIVAEGTIDLSELVTHRYQISQIEQAVIATEKYYGLRTVINKF